MTLTYANLIFVLNLTHYHRTAELLLSEAQTLRKQLRNATTVKHDALQVPERAAAWDELLEQNMRSGS